MRRYFSADLHLGSTRVLKACNRPFLDNVDMTRKLIDNFNEVARDPDDIIYHIGDLFCLKQDGGEIGLDQPWNYYKDHFVANIINIEGNHDPNNGIKSLCTSLRLTLGKAFYCLLSHYPSYDNRTLSVAKPGDIVLCGHVHDTWPYKRFYVDKKNSILNINVGVDVWDYQPVSEVTLVNFIKNLMIENNPLLATI